MRQGEKPDLAMNARSPSSITRREAIQRVSALLGGTALVCGNAFLKFAVAGEPSARSGGESLFSEQDVLLLDEVAETILPETGTPGAKAAGVGPFIALFVTDCFAPDDRVSFHEGLNQLDAGCAERYGAGFLKVTPEQRLAYLNQLDQQQHEFMNDGEEGAPAPYFRTMKELVLFGYFTSEIGATQALRYVEAPGAYKPCIPYAPGDRAWAPHA
jgi:hypothetical protein